MDTCRQKWTVYLRLDDRGVAHGHVTRYDDTTKLEECVYEFSGSSSLLFQELMSALDASIFTSLAIAEGVLPEGQLPLL